MKRLRFLLILFVLAAVLFSCASNADEVTEEEVPVVQVVEETPSEEADAAEEPVTSEPVAEEPVYEEAISSEPAADETGEVEAAAEDEEPVIQDDEFIPVEEEFITAEEERVYTLDVTTYYDDFLISDDDFVVIEIPEPEPEPEPQAVLPVTVPVTVTDEQIVLDEPDEEVFPVLEAVSPAMEPLFVPAPREDMKKPVELISEEAAVASLEQNVGDGLSAVEEILAEIPVIEEPQEPVPSRAVTIHKNDILKVPYQGNWWVYLGDEKNSNVLVFSGRDYVSEKTVFTLRAVKEGTALLHFYKQDIIANVLVDDYLEVNVEESEDSSEHVTLDMFIISQIKSVPPESDESGEESADSLASAVPEKTPVPAVLSAEPQYVQVEQPSAVVSSDAAYGIMEESEVISAVEEEVSDEELYRKAQELEAADIEGALELYRKLVAEYPASPYWTKANNRITYINRFYFFKR